VTVQTIELVLFQLLKWWLFLLPIKSVQRCGAFLGSAAFHVMGNRRRIALDNLTHAFPDRSRQELTAIARSAFQNYGIAFAELLWFPRLDDMGLRRLVTFRNIELLQSRLNDGNGVILLSGHFGNWELIALSGGYFCRKPITIVVQTQNNKRVDRAINRHRSVFGNRIVPRESSVREIIKALDHGDGVAMAPDQSGPSDGVFVNFFGRRAATHQGPAVFALRCGSPMVIGFLVRRPDMTYEATLEEIPTDNLPPTESEAVVELTQRYTSVLEEYIRRYPDHWLWMHRRWKHAERPVEVDAETTARA
jgi:KDO2-lipid IV(A) lauroyltransferase